jgi:hypothetical protein
MKADLNSEFSIRVLRALWGQKGAQLDGKEGEGREEAERLEGKRSEGGEAGLQVRTYMKSSSR